MDEQNKKGGGLSWTQSPVSKSDEQKSNARTPVVPPKVPVQLPLTAPGPHTPTTMPVVIASLVVGIIAGVLIGWLWFINPRTDEGGAPTPGVAAEEEVEEEAPSVPAPSGISTLGSSITVSNQPAGSLVGISSASVSVPTWIVVYESRNGAPGNALGAKLFFPEEKSGAVYLLRNTTAGQTYFVGARRDNGNRVFSLESDTPAVDATGKMVLTQFQAN